MTKMTNVKITPLFNGVATKPGNLTKVKEVDCTVHRSSNRNTLGDEWWTGLGKLRPVSQQCGSMKVAMEIRKTRNCGVATSVVEPLHVSPPGPR